MGPWVALCDGKGPAWLLLVLVRKSLCLVFRCECDFVIGSVVVVLLMLLLLQSRQSRPLLSIGPVGTRARGTQALHVDANPQASEPHADAFAIAEPTTTR